MSYGIIPAKKIQKGNLVRFRVSYEAPGIPVSSYAATCEYIGEARITGSGEDTEIEVVNCWFAVDPEDTRRPGEWTSFNYYTDLPVFNDPNSKMYRAVRQMIEQEVFDRSELANPSHVWLPVDEN